MASPSIEAQQKFWNDWNRKWRFRSDPDEFMARQREVACDYAARVRLQGASILEVGCGTGWLGNALVPFGKVTGTDLSPDSIEEGRRRYPDIELLCGDFLERDFKRRFDLVVSADAIAHFADQRDFVNRIAALLRPGGHFLLMTQNSFVWRRRSALQAAAPGQLRRWPTVKELREFLQKDFEVEHISSIVPGGDMGILFWVENRWLRGGANLVLGRRRWRSLLESARLGRELVIMARRRG